MENELAQLSINDEEEEIIHIPTDPSTENRGETTKLVGCFLTTSTIHFPAMKSTMANLWHPVKGVRICDLGEKSYLFQFFHVMDMNKVLKGSPWTFNHHPLVLYKLDMNKVLKGSPWTFNHHLLVLYKLELGEDPLQVPLVLTPFWVQVHDVPTGLFSKILAAQLGNFLGNFMEHDVSYLGKENRNFMRIRVQIDIRSPLKRRKKISFGGKCSYVTFKYERLSLFCFYCGRLGHNDSFCEAKMNLGVEIAEMGWDLSIRAQSRRSLSMNNIWLREERDGDNGGTDAEFGGFRMGQKHPGWKIKYGKSVDPVLGFNLEGGSSYA
ncbi:hypothetical protein Goarm_022376, partial [Gossypium armourianum]|nr:hypothetical protein [Gossypium armourianum]